MHNLVIDHGYSYIEPRLPIEVHTKLFTTLRYRPEGIQHSWAFKHKKIDGYTYLFDGLNQKFRTGLERRVQRILTDAGLQYNVIDRRQYTNWSLDHLRNPRLPGDPYQYQIDAASSTIDKTHGIIASPTGTGKTWIMTLITSQFHTRTLIVVNSTVLLDQTFEFLDMVYPGHVGMVGAGEFELNDVVVATIQTLASIMGLGKKQDATARAPALVEWLKGVGLVIHDEVHGADSDSAFELYTKFPGKCFFGTTATPYAWAKSTEKGANLELEQHFGTKIFDSRERYDFVNLGITVPLYIQRILTPVIPTLIGQTNGFGFVYKDIIDAQVINNEERTQQIAAKAAEMAKDGLSTYIYYNRISYGEALCAAMKGLDPVMLQGSTPRSKRQDIFKAVENKQQLVVVSDIGSYGLNIRSLNTIILASPVKDVRQLKGRVCRSAPGKKYGLVLDMVDEVPLLYSHAKLRSKQFEQDGDTIIG